MLKWEAEQKQSLLISQTQPVTVSLLSSSSWNSPFDPTWPPITVPLTMTCRIRSGDFDFLFHKNTPLALLEAALCVAARRLGGEGFRIRPPFLPFPSCHRISYAAFKSLINRWFVENTVYYSFFLTRWFNCLRAKRISVCCPVCWESVWVSSARMLMKRDSSWPRKYVPFILRSLHYYCVAQKRGQHKVNHNSCICALMCRSVYTHPERWSSFWVG